MGSNRTGGSNSRNNSEIEKHKDFAHKGVRYQCEICQKIFGYPKELKLHLKKSHLLKNVETLNVTNYQIVDKSKIEKIERFERIEKFERSEKFKRCEKFEKTEKIDKSEIVDHKEKYVKLRFKEII